MVKLLRNDHTSTLHFTKISKTHNSKQPYAGVNCLLEWLTREEKDFGVRHWTLRLQYGKRNYSISYERVAARFNFYAEGAENQCYGQKVPTITLRFNVCHLIRTYFLKTFPIFRIRYH